MCSRVQQCMRYSPGSACHCMRVSGQYCEVLAALSTQPWVVSQAGRIPDYLPLFPPPTQRCFSTAATLGFQQIPVGVGLGWAPAVSVRCWVGQGLLGLVLRSPALWH